MVTKKLKPNPYKPLSWSVSCRICFAKLNNLLLKLYLFPSWCQSKRWWLNPIIVNGIGIRMHEIFTFSIWIPYRKYLIKKYQFSVSRRFYLRIATAQFRVARYFRSLAIQTFSVDSSTYFPNCATQHAAVCLIISYKQYGWCISAVN